MASQRLSSAAPGVSTTQSGLQAVSEKRKERKCEVEDICLLGLPRGSRAGRRHHRHHRLHPGKQVPGAGKSRYKMLTYFRSTKKRIFPTANVSGIKTQQLLFTADLLM